MKIRNGFVSNSSSSSFVIYIKDDKLSHTELMDKSLAVLEKEYGFSAYSDEDDKQYYIKMAEKFAKEQEFIASILRIEMGDEEGVENVAKKFIELCNASHISYKWMDC